MKSPCNNTYMPSVSIWRRFCWYFRSIKKAIQERKDRACLCMERAHQIRAAEEEIGTQIGEIKMWRRRFLAEKGWTQSNMPNAYDVFMSYRSSRMLGGPDHLFEKAKSTQLNF